MRAPRKRLVTSDLAALHLKLTHGVTVSAVTVRQWAARGHIARHDGSPAGVFDLDEIDAYVQKRLRGGTLRPDRE